MKHNTGIWIDHRKAVVVSLASDGERTTVVTSNVEKHPQRGGDSPMSGPYESRQVQADDSRQRALTGELAGYYDSVIAVLGDTGNLVLFGPGEAKGEFNKHLAKENSDIDVVAIETEDKMSDRQIAAKVRAHFGLDAPRRQPQLQ